MIINLPYAFSSSIFGVSIGYIYGVSGYPQKQSVVFGTAMAGTSGSGMVLLMAKDIRVFGLNRLYVDPVVSVGYFGEFDTYIDGNPKFPDQRAGSNSSDVDNNIQGKGWDNLFRLRFNYLLPIGYGKNHVTKDYRLDRGLLKSGASGGESLNPFKSGKTFFEITPFYRSITIESDDISDTEIKTNGVDLALNWDNRDYPANPSRGHGLEVKVSRDFGWLESSKSWTAYQAEFDKYIGLGSNGWLRQSVIAFDFWAAYSSTWEVSVSGDNMNNPPPFAGASLGGYWRMRGYPTQRFNDKAAIYYGLELRLIPNWNPFESWGWLQKRLGVQWVQFVPFFEVGRVASEWDLSELHDNMKWDAGLGLRFNAKGMVLRIDTAVSEEDYWIQMMVAQPFQF
jgi:outer membrane protein assembly factor BamA